MTAMLPIFPGQVERWRRPRPEPVELPLPGWECSIIEPDDTFPNQRTWTFRRGAGRVELFRYWDQPRNPGMPMAVAGERPVVVAGRACQLLTTSMFNGVAKRVQLIWLTGKGHDVEYGVRITLDGCDEKTTEEVLSSIVVRW